MKRKLNKRLIWWLLLSLFLLICWFFLQQKLVSVDWQSIFYPVKTLLEKNSLDMWDDYNAKYETNYFKYVFSDTVFDITQNNKIFPMQQISLILFYSVFMAVFWLSSFFYINIILWLFIVIFSYLILRKRYKSRILQIFGLLLITFSPLLILYVILPQNIIPAIFFLIVSFYLLMKNYWNWDSISRILSIVFFLMACYIRIPILLFGVLFLPCLFNKWKFKFRLTSWLIVSLIFILPFFLLNIKYFWNRNFIWYFHTNDRPFIINYWILATPLYVSWYSHLLVSVQTFFFAILKFFKWSLIIFSPTILFSIFTILLRKKNIQDRNLFISILIAFIINLFYYANMESQLWHDKRPEFTLTLALAFFRYMEPTYILMLFFVPFFFRRATKGQMIFYIFFIVSIFSIATVSYKWWSNLKYFNEIEDKRSNYAMSLNSWWLIKFWSTILFDERTAQYYLYPNVDKYHWFCYYCIPPAIRFQYTQEVLDKMLFSGEAIYFASFWTPYNDNSQDMEDFLNKNFILEYVTGSTFNREKFKFLKILDEK